MDPKVKNILEWVVCVIVAIILALVIRYFIGTPTVVESSSMHPTLIEGQRLIISRLGRIVKPTYERGEIITFEAPEMVYNNLSSDSTVATFHKTSNFFEDFSYYFLEIGKTSYIKRVIGLPGEHIKIEDGKVYINGEELDEPYLKDSVETNRTGTFYDLVVPEDTLFVMGDNRDSSKDSRSFGCIPMDKIESKVWIRFWPFNLFGEVK